MIFERDYDAVFLKSHFFSCKKIICHTRSLSQAPFCYTWSQAFTRGFIGEEICTIWFCFPAVGHPFLKWPSPVWCWTQCQHWRPATANSRTRWTQPWAGDWVEMTATASQAQSKEVDFVIVGMMRNGVQHMIRPWTAALSLAPQYFPMMSPLSDHWMHLSLSPGTCPTTQEWHFPLWSW